MCAHTHVEQVSGESPGRGKLGAGRGQGRETAGLQRESPLPVLLFFRQQCFECPGTTGCKRTANSVPETFPLQA